MRQLAIATVSEFFFESIERAIVEILHFPTANAHDVVMVRAFLVGELVTNGAIAEIAAPNEACLLKNGKRPVHRDQIARLTADFSVQFFERERPVLASQAVEKYATRRCRFELRATQQPRRFFPGGYRWRRSPSAASARARS